MLEGAGRARGGAQQREVREGVVRIVNPFLFVSNLPFNYATNFKTTALAS